MGLLTDDLIKQNPFIYKESEKMSKGCFYEALLEELCAHYDNNILYRTFCTNKNFNPHFFAGNIDEIPAVHVSVFKELGNQLSSVSKDKVKLTLQSSATSGVPSSVPVDSITSKRQVKAMIRVVGDFIGNERRPFLIMDVDPMQGFQRQLGARYAAVSGYLNFASEAGYFLKADDTNTYFFDIDGINNFIEKLKGESAVVFGFTYILYSEVLKPLAEKNIRFHLPEGSKLIHIGGWKKMESEKIGKGQFNRMAADLFGISVEDVIDIYGFTEQMGLNYPDCKCGCKHAPLYSQVFVRDIRTKEILPPGREGLLEFVTPIPHSYPGNVVLTDDIGMLVDGACEYHRAGVRFKVSGRLKKAEIRGCGDILSSKLKFAGDQVRSDNDQTSDKYQVYYKESFGSDGLSAEEVVSSLCDKLRGQLSWLRRQPIDALIGLIAKTAEKWKAGSNLFSDTQDQGLKYLILWCTSGHLNRIATEGLRGNRMYADHFTAIDDTGVRFMRATSRGLICHWLAGNVQVLGMFVLIQSILTKNVNLLRVSSRDKGVFWSLLSAFEGVCFTTKGGYTISGDALLKTIAVIYFDHSDEKAGRKMSMLADARVAWGGREAVSAVTSYPARYDCEDIIMGPKLSFSVVSKEAISDERKAKKLARKIAVDASVFDQTGCASPHNIFVEHGGAITPLEFAKYLADGMEKAAKQIPKAAMTPEELSAVHSVRGIYDFKGTVYGDEDSVWTVVYSDQDELHAPVYSRVLFVHGVEHLADTLQYVSDDVQTIGLAAGGEKAAEYATAAAQRGAARFPACGRMLNFESPWDGMFIMERLVRWNTLGETLL